MLPQEVDRVVRRYLSDADRRLPGLIDCFYVVGSTAMGAYRPRRSDVDFVAVLSRSPSADELAALRRLQLRSGVRTASRAIIQRRSPLTGTLNGVFIDPDDIARPVSEIEPIAAQTGHTFVLRSRTSDVSPVAWKTLLDHGITVRGPAPTELGLVGEAERLAEWNRRNLQEYWLPWADQMERDPRRWFSLRPRYAVAWGMLGPPRLHCTITTGEVVSKEAAGEYAKTAFGDLHHELLDDALAYWRSEPPPRRLTRKHRLEGTVAFVREVASTVT